MSDEKDPLADYSTEDIDRPKEYFRLKKSTSVLRKDLKDIEIQHPEYEALQKLKREAKKIREEMDENEEIKEIKEKVKEMKERMDLLKEMIRIDLIENSELEIKQDGKVLKLIYVVKEGKEEDK